MDSHLRLSLEGKRATANQFAEQLSQIEILRNSGSSKDSMASCTLELCNREASPYFIKESLLLSEGRFIKSEVNVVSSLNPNAEQIIIPDGIAVLDKIRQAIQRSFLPLPL